MIGVSPLAQCQRGTRSQDADCLSRNSRLEGYLILLGSVGDSPNYIVKLIDCEAFSLVSLNKHAIVTELKESNNSILLLSR